MTHDRETHKTLLTGEKTNSVAEKRSWYLCVVPVRCKPKICQNVEKIDHWLRENYVAAARAIDNEDMGSLMDSKMMKNTLECTEVDCRYDHDYHAKIDFFIDRNDA